MNTDWTQHPCFAALDWASDHYDVIVLDRHGAVQVEFRFAHTADGWAEFTTKMQPFTGAPLTLETSSGPAVDQLLQRGRAVYPVAPPAAARYRERKVPSGTKTDRHDTWAPADADALMCQAGVSPVSYQSGKGVQMPSAPGVQQSAARHRASVGQRQPPDL